MKIVTVGVYGSSEQRFFDALVKAKVDVFCDIRLRRGMRGSTYSFANSNSLQRRLSDLGIEYVHFLDLAPTQDIRKKQKLADTNEHVTKSERKTLSNEFIQMFQNEILSRFNAESFLERIMSKQVAALFCVEREPLACHRSLVANYLSNRLALAVEDLRP